MTNNFETEIACSFCGRSQSLVERLIEGPGVYICNDCVNIAVSILEADETKAQNKKTKSSIDIDNLPTPKEIFSHLGEYVIGQDLAKRALSVAVYNHYKRILAKENNLSKDDTELNKANVLIIGNTGTGKTYLAQTLARIMKVPFAIVDATTLTQAGYVGEDVENILVRLVQNSDGDIQKASKGIIYIDEIDKISRKGDNPSITRDVSGEGVQQSLLKIIEGTVANIPTKNMAGGRKHPGQETTQIDTKDILFIVGGAFDGLKDILKTRDRSAKIGFGAKINRGFESEYNIYQDVRPEDLQKFGLIPELIGRLPVITSVDDLDEKTMLRILLDPKNSLVKQFKKLFILDDVKLKFEKEALRVIVQKAFSFKTGARGLRSILEKTLEPIMFEIPSRDDISQVIVTKKAAEGLEDPKIIIKEQIVKNNRRVRVA
ncbi:MAG: ATP-dependent Clp protease ATP-binding subunit ClpX [Bifidobacteriaceae bacterium]|jgi:ATP-dependent Clp protease ATP-binding subunit ClpX|nr:ATP-dependent Clp protease ATP-binding subunit ClpX [Bifidobacteriaceae bacterium]